MGILLTSGGQGSFGPGGRLRLAVPTGARTSVLQARGAVKHQKPKGFFALDGRVTEVGPTPGGRPPPPSGRCGSRSGAVLWPDLAPPAATPDCACRCSSRPSSRL